MLKREHLLNHLRLSYFCILSYHVNTTDRFVNLYNISNLRLTDRLSKIEFHFSFILNGWIYFYIYEHEKMCNV